MVKVLMMESQLSSVGLCSWVGTGTVPHLTAWMTLLERYQSAHRGGVTNSEPTGSNVDCEE